MALSFQQRVAYLRCKRRMQSCLLQRWVIVLFFLSLMCGLHLLLSKSSMTKPADEDSFQPVSSRFRHGIYRAKELTEKKSDEKEHPGATKPPTSLSQSQDDLNIPRLDLLMCVMQIGLKMAGEEIRVIKQTVAEEEQGKVGIKAALTRIVGVIRKHWPEASISDVREVILDGISAMDFDDTPCHPKEIKQFDKKLEIIVNPIDSIPELVSNSLHHVTASACVLYNSRPVAGIIYQPFLRRNVWAIAGGNHSPNIAPFPKGTLAVYGVHGHDVEKAKDRFRSMAIAVAGSDDFAALALLLDGGKVENAQALFSHYVSFKSTPAAKLCAAEVVVKSAGGRIVDLAGNPINYSKKQNLIDGYIMTTAIQNNNK